MVDPGEEIAAAAVREVREETGIECEFVGIDCWRATHDGPSHQTNLYFIVTLKPLTSQIVVQESEIAHAAWLALDEFVALPFRGVYKALHETAVHNMTHPTNRWSCQALPVVFRPGNKRVYAW